MNNEDQALIRSVRGYLIGTIVLLLAVGGGATVVSNAYNLAWFPWDVRMKTGMIRASNSYITTQQSALRQFRTDYEDADAPAQKAAIVRQMRGIADTIPDDLQPDIRTFLASH